ncbi:MAG: ribonuclease HI family protein [Patescibacteria group bacterium]
MKLKIHTDGGSLSNPGQAAIGYLLYAEDGSVLFSEGKAIGVASNNVAEYTALVQALTKTHELMQTGKLSNIESIAVFADSELMVKQLKGLYKVKHSAMRDLIFQVRVAEGNVGVPVSYTHVLREKNAAADKLVKEALGK